MALDVTSYALSKGFTSESLLGGGAVVGKNVTISFVTPITGGNRVTFSYTLDDGTVKTSTMDVMDGKDGIDGLPGKDGKDGLNGKDGQQGADGADGIGISKIEKISTVDLVDTYRITFTDNSTFDYEVTNGKDGQGGTGASTWSEISDKPFESLSTDFSVENGELKVVGGTGGGEENVQSDWNETDATSDAFIKNKPTIPDAYDDTALSNRVKTIEDDYAKSSDIPSLSGYATETWVNEQGFLTQHQDLTDYAKKSEIPTVPSKVSELANDSNYQTAEQVNSTVATEIAKIVADAPEDFDTLKEMSDWIAGHENYASAMNSAISDNETAITALQTGKADKSEIPTTVAELTDSADYAKKTDIPTTLPADGGNADTVNNHTIESDVPENAVFTDTIYDDTEVKESIENLKKYVDDSVGNVPDEKITEAVNTYLNENPVAPGATAEQVAKIDKNVSDITELKGDLADVNKKFAGGTLNPDGNLIFETEIEIGAWIDNTTGEKQKNQYTDSYCCTPFIEIKPSTSYYVVCFVGNNKKAPYSICFYTEENTFISDLRYPTLFTTPDNAKYVRLTWDGYNDMVGTGAFLLKKSTEAVTIYEAPSYTPIRLVDSDYVTKEVTDNLDERVTVLEGSSNKQYINLASDYYITNGDTLELFHRGLLNLGDYKKYNIKIECSAGGYFEKRYIFTPTSSNVGNDYPFTLSLYDDNDKLIESATTTIHCIEKKSNPSNQVNVLCVGDSLTAGGQWVTELRRLLDIDGLTNVKFIGTCGTSTNKYEGYGGWSIASYNSSMATNAYMWVNVSSHDKTSADQHSVYVDSNSAKWKIETIETNRLKMIRTSGSSAIPTSGSLIWESGGDNHSDIVYSSVEQASGNPFWNESTNKNDFVTYANQQGVSTIDYCLILIGWNQSDWNESITKSETNRFINSLQTGFPNCKIILAGLQIPSLDGCGNNYGCDWYWKEKVNFVFNLQKWYEDIASSNDNVIFTQVSGQFDSENNMPMYQRIVNKRNSNKEFFGGNGVHPADSGYLQIADVFYRAFESFN